MGPCFLCTALFAVLSCFNIWTQSVRTIRAAAEETSAEHLSRMLQDSSVIFDPAALPKGGVSPRGGGSGRGSRGRRSRPTGGTGTGTATNGLATHEKSALSEASGIFVLPVSKDILPVPEPWANVTMPEKSYFLGFPAPSDPLKWNQAQLQASRGEQVLLSKILQTIKSPTELFSGDNKFRAVHRLAEYHCSRKEGFLNRVEHVKGARAPIVMLGYRRFSNGDHEGRETGLDSLGMNEILVNKKNFKIPRPIVAIGNMDENWGWLSTYFLNRTVPWAFSFDGSMDPFNPRFTPPQKQVQSFLDDPNLIMMVVNQHHNITHPKVISMPLGLNDPKQIWFPVQKAAKTGMKKDLLFFSAGSNWGFRPAIRKCIANKLGSAFSATPTKISQDAFRQRLIASMAVLAMPGLGVDSYRMWESLASGAMPVSEKGMGMDRTFYKLPVLLVEDYAALTEYLLRQAYVEALYWADQWEYERMTPRWYERLIYEVADSASIAPLLRMHPMIEDTNFTRPLVPYTCVHPKTGANTCGPGTKRTPKESCAIDPKAVNKGYNWVWNHDRRRRRRRLLEQLSVEEGLGSYTGTGTGGTGTGTGGVSPPLTMEADSVTRYSSSRTKETKTMPASTGTANITTTTTAASALSTLTRTGSKEDATAAASSSGTIRSMFTSEPTTSSYTKKSPSLRSFAGSSASISATSSTRSLRSSSSAGPMHINTDTDTATSIKRVLSLSDMSDLDLMREHPLLANKLIEIDEFDSVVWSMPA